MYRRPKRVMAAAISATLLALPFLAFASFDQNLRYGDRGPAVAELQQFLIAQGDLAPNLATGYFGPLTRSAVKAFQTRNGIAPARGFWGPLTRSAAAQSGGYMFSARTRSKLIEPDRIAALASSGGRVNVIVMLTLPGTAAAADASTAAGMATIKAAVMTVQDQVLAAVLPTVPAAASELATPQRISRFSGIPGFAASLTTAEIEAMAAHPLVISVSENAEAKKHLDRMLPQS